MRNILLLLATFAVLAPTLSGCDTAGEQIVRWKPGNDLAILIDEDASNAATPYDGFAPGTAYLYVQAHNRNWTYDWAVTPGLPSEVLQDGQFFKIDYDAAGTYTVTVQTRIDGKAYDDTLAVNISLPDALTQVGRLPQFATLQTMIDRVALAETIPDSAVTILAPTNAAFVTAFDTNGDGTLQDDEIPADSLLTGILKMHIIPQVLTANKIEDGGAYMTLEDCEVGFQVFGDQVTVVVQNDGGKILSWATLTQTVEQVADGVIHVIDRVLLPTEHR